MTCLFDSVHRAQIRLNLPSATNSRSHLRQVRLIGLGLGNSGFLIDPTAICSFLFVVVDPVKSLRIEHCMTLFFFQNILGNKEAIHRLYPSPYKSNHTPHRHCKKLSTSIHLHHTIYIFLREKGQNP